MNVVVVGGGIISSRLVEFLTQSDQVRCFSIRLLPDNSKEWQGVVSACLESELVVYLAYHHRDMLKNIRLIRKVLSELKQASWGGKFVFFNSQSSIATTVLKSDRKLVEPYCYDLYTTTKRLQSYSLAAYSDAIDISELYLPVILGRGTKAQMRYEYIGRHSIVNLPNSGNNMLAYLDVEIFAIWFWDSFASKAQISANKPRRIFVYQDTISFADMIRELQRSGNKLGDVVQADEYKSIVYKELTYKYRFHDKLLRSCSYALRLTPIWLVLSVLRNEYNKLWSTRKISTETEAKQIDSVVEEQFIPVGAEYQYMTTSINLNAIPFETVRIGL